MDMDNVNATLVAAAAVAAPETTTTFSSTYTNLSSASFALPDLPSYTLEPLPPLIPWIPDKYLALLLPIVAYWVLSMIFHFIDTLDLFPQYRLHTPAEVLKRNRASRWEVVRDVVIQQIIQTLFGLSLAAVEDDGQTGKDAYNVAAWAQRLRLAQSALPKVLALFGLDSVKLADRALRYSPQLAGALAGGKYPWLQQQQQPFTFTDWELGFASLIYWVIIPALQFGLAICILDTWQYFLHRAMHMNKFLYTTFHARHHRLYVPYAYGALYNHPFEGFLLDTAGTGIAYLVSGMTTRQSIWFYTGSTIKTVDDHCGYALPWDPLQHITSNNAGYHDVHHQSWGIKTNFSQPFFTFWDRLLGTAWTGGDVSARYERARLAAEQAVRLDSASAPPPQKMQQAPLTREVVESVDVAKAEKQEFKEEQQQQQSKSPERAQMVVEPVAPVEADEAKQVDFEAFNEPEEVKVDEASEAKEFQVEQVDEREQAAVDVDEANKTEEKVNIDEADTVNECHDEVIIEDLQMDQASREDIKMAKVIIEDDQTNDDDYIKANETTTQDHIIKRPLEDIQESEPAPEFSSSIVGTVESVDTIIEEEEAEEEQPQQHSPCYTPITGSRPIDSILEEKAPYAEDEESAILLTPDLEKTLQTEMEIPAGKATAQAAASRQQILEDTSGAGGASVLIDEIKEEAKETRRLSASRIPISTNELTRRRSGRLSRSPTPTNTQTLVQQQQQTQPPQYHHRMSNPPTPTSSSSSLPMSTPTTPSSSPMKGLRDRVSAGATADRRRSSGHYHGRTSGVLGLAMETSR